MSTAASTRAEDTRRYRRALIGPVLVAPVAVAVAGSTVLLAALPSLPDRVLMHWGPDGTSSGSPLGALLCLPLTAALSTVLWLVLRRPEQVRRTARARAATGVPMWLACFLTVGLVGTVVLQVHPDAPVPWLPLLVGAVTGGIAWLVVAVTMPEPPASALTGMPTTVATSMAPPSDGQRLAWFGRATAAPAVVGVLVVALGVAVVGVVLGAFAGSTASGVVALLPAVLLAAVASLLAWRVRIGASGLEAVAGLGLPRLRVPLAAIADARVVSVTPLGDFGGFGLRHARGRVGIVTRGGDALEVVRHDGSRLVLTVEHPAEAAGTLRALLAAD